MRRTRDRALLFYGCLDLVLLAAAAVVFAILLNLLSTPGGDPLAAFLAASVAETPASPTDTPTPLVATLTAPAPTRLPQPPTAVPALPSPTIPVVSTLTPTPTTTVPTPAALTTTPTATLVPPAPPLALADIFPARDLAPIHFDPSRLRVVIATGDVVPARSADVAIRSRMDDFLFPIAATKELLAAGDLTIANLEAALIKNCPYHDSGFMLCGRPGFIQTLQAGGVDVVTLENNHISNYGPAGVAETHKHLEAAEIAWVNRDNPVLREVRGLKFGILAFNGVGERFDRVFLARQIREWRDKVDVVIVALHWGKEYESTPQVAPGIADDNPVEIAHLAVDAGADLIIGNHPHWIQGVELYKGKFIAYAHGNFIFDQMWSEETRLGVIGKYTFYDRTLVKVEFIPTRIENYAQPVPLDGKEAQAVLDGMKAASEKIAPK